MGIARFYRWLSERYPLINEVIDVDSVPDFDNFYLDMNGIIHHCSHGNTGGRKQASEDHMWLDVFKYVSGLVYRIKPKKLVYLAVDGVAPRAKMNQQRSRRFRSAHDAKESREKTDKMKQSNGKSGGESAQGFDSNCITPGTAFMERLVHHLEFFVQKKIGEDPLWKDLKIVLSGPDVPGEGEHKIMDYIRSIKSQPAYDANTRHCLYGLDADLIMLSLASHEPYFALLREEIDFSFSRTKSKENRSMVKSDKFQLLHISLLREYLALDFLGDFYLEDRAGSSSLLDRVIDDFVLFCFLVGNDFLPHLPFGEIGEGGLNKLFECYKLLMKAKGEEGHFLSSMNGNINYGNLFLFLQSYLEVEAGLIEEMLTNDRWKIGETRVCNSATPQPITSELYRDDMMPAADSSSEEGWKTNVVSKKNIRRVSRGTPESVQAAMDEYYDIKLGIVTGTAEGKNQLENLVLSYLEALQWIYLYYYKGPPSWDWYYPFHYSPFALDLVQILAEKFDSGNALSFKFDLGKPFLPFQQLMAVLPPASGKNFLPPSLYNLMVAPESPIRSFYPEEFEIDIDGVRVPWGGVTIIPFVDEKLLVRVINETIASKGLLDEEKRRNSLGQAKVFYSANGLSDRAAPSASLVESVVSTIPSLVKNVETCRIFVEPFSHAPLPAAVEIFPHYVLPGFSVKAHPDFPSLFKFEDLFVIAFSYGSGVRIFNSMSKQESLFVSLTIKNLRLSELANLHSDASSETVSCNFPFYSKTSTVMSITDVTGRVKLAKNGGRVTDRSFDKGKYESDIDYLVSRLEESGLRIQFEPPQTEGAMTDVEMYYSQPVLEVADDKGDLVKVLGCIAVVKEKKERLVSLSRRASPATSSADLSALAITAPLGGISLNTKSPLIFGQPFKFVDQGTRAKFTHIPSEDSIACISAAINDLLGITKSVKYTQWFSVSEVATSIGRSPDFVWSVFGEVWIRFGKFQEEVGMNLWSYSSTGEPQCVAGFSQFAPGKNRRSAGNGRCYRNRWEQPDRREWKFSLEATHQLNRYMRDWPELMTELAQAVSGAHTNAINGGITVQGKRLFLRFKRPEGTRNLSGRDDWVSDYYLGQIVSYVNGQRWKTFSICSYEYQSLQPEFVKVISDFVDRFPQLVTETVVPETQVFPLSAQSIQTALRNELQIGQRGIYVKDNGIVPIGTWGTVVGIYGSVREMRVDILLDKESLNASSLNGVCPEMRGIRVTRQEFVAPIFGPAPVIRDNQIKSAKNKILADLILEMDKNVTQKVTAVQSLRRPDSAAQLVPTNPAGPIGIKININDLFGKNAHVTQPESATQAPSRRPLPPTALFNLPQELTGTTPPLTPPQRQSGEIPEFLLAKLRNKQQPPK